MTIYQLYNTVVSALASKRGAAMVEYALLAGLIAVVAVTALGTLGNNVTSVFSGIATKV